MPADTETRPTATSRRAAFRGLLIAEYLVIRRDPTTYVLLFIVPLVLSSLTQDVFAVGYDDERGEVIAMAAFSGLFLSMISTWVIYSFFKDHGWHIWDRMRLSVLSMPAIVLAKLLPYAVLGTLQLAVLYAVVAVLPGSPGLTFGEYLLLLVASLPLLLLTLAAALLAVAVMKSHVQATTLANLFALLSAGIGGALAPRALLPAWTRFVSPVTPHYWFLKSVESAIGLTSDSEGLIGAAVLCVAAVVVFVLAVRWFQSDDEKAFGY